MTAKGYAITLGGTEGGFRCAPEGTVLKAMARLGRKGIAVSCRSGGCGICRVLIVQGRVRAESMNRAQVSAEDEQNGIALACRAKPLPDVRLCVPGMKPSAQRATAPVAGKTV